MARKKYSSYEKDIMKDISNNLKRILSLRGMTQTSLADKCDLPTRSVLMPDIHWFSGLGNMHHYAGLWHFGHQYGTKMAPGGTNLLNVSQAHLPLYRGL